MSDLAAENTEIVLSRAEALAKPVEEYRREIEVVKDLIAKNFTDDELHVAAKMAKAYGLNPFCKEIYFIKYGKTGDIIIQVGIDGFRKIAMRSGKYQGPGQTLFSGDPKAEQWQRAWDTEKSGELLFAEAGCFHADYKQEIREVAAYRSYHQNTPMWKNMADNQLAKCAEARAIRRGFNLVGIYIPEELRQEPQDQRPTYDPLLGEMHKSESGPIVKEVWDLAHKMTGGVNKEARLYRFGTDPKVGLIDIDPNTGKPNLFATRLSKIQSLVIELQKRTANISENPPVSVSEPAESPSNEVKEQEQPTEDEPQDAEFTAKEEVSTADRAALTMEIERLESEVSQIEKPEKRGQWYAEQFEDCEAYFTESLGDADGLLPPWDSKKNRPVWTEATDSQLEAWRDWLKELVAKS